MNVLWITNVILPEAQALLSGNGTLNASGGWMLGAAENLVSQPGIHLTIATVSRRVRKLCRLEGEKITYYILPSGLKGNHRINHSLEPYWKQVKDKVKPDVIHLHGTEFTHGLAYLEACGAEHVCVSIQGLVSAYNYYYYGLTQKEIRSSFTLRSLLRGGIISGYKDFRYRAKTEIEILSRVNHIIGRTQWDRQRTWAINPDATYHYGGETLRKDFYSGKIWVYNECKPHSIFLSQAGYPIKGLHMLLKAMPLILRHYPDATVRVAGTDIIRRNNFIDCMSLSNYGNLIRRYLKKYNLCGVVSFTGPLSGDGMRNEYLHCNVFVCPSSIENSPNSIGEAQLLGVPVVASYVGGVMDMMQGNEDNMYRFEEVEMMAYKICHIFEQRDTVNTSLMRELALKRHDPKRNVENLIKIYHAVSKAL